MNVQVIRFQEANREFLARAVLQALRLHKEEQRAEIMEHALRQDMDLALVEHQTTIQNLQSGDEGTN